MSFYDLSPHALRKAQPPRQPFPLLETGENLASTLLELQRRQHDDWITNALEVVVEGLDGYQVYQMGQHLVTKLHYTFHNGRVRQFSSHLKNEADGTIRMLGILTALYQERFPSPLAFEEPEKAIYTDVLALLCEQFQNAANWTYQLILTTHRPDFIDDLPIGSLLIVEKEDGISQIGPLIEEQQQIIAQDIFSAGELMQIEGLFREGASLIAKV
jgi:predicted ATPase